MSERRYNKIIQTLEEGRRSLARARLTAGALRFLGVALATLAAQRILDALSDGA